MRGGSTFQRGGSGVLSVNRLPAAVGGEAGRGGDGRSGDEIDLAATLGWHELGLRWGRNVSPGVN